MRDGRYIAAGLLVFIAIATFPFWSAGGKAAPAPQPSIDTPAIQALRLKQCVEEREAIRAGHLQLLADWRERAVRDGERIFLAAGGERYEFSLQNTCLKCHSNKEQFCDRCHAYAGVEPDCWGCHLAPKEKR